MAKKTRTAISARPTIIADIKHPQSATTYTLGLVVDDSLQRIDKCEVFIQYLATSLQSKFKKPSVVLGINSPTYNSNVIAIGPTAILHASAHLIWDVHRIIIIDCNGNLQDVVEMAMRMKKPFQYFSAPKPKSPFTDYRKVSLTKHAHD